jgi:hypothetical protein
LENHQFRVFQKLQRIAWVSLKNWQKTPVVLGSHLIVFQNLGELWLRILNRVFEFLITMVIYIYIYINWVLLHLITMMINSDIRIDTRWGVCCKFLIPVPLWVDYSLIWKKFVCKVPSGALGLFHLRTVVTLVGWSVVP